MHRYQKQKVPPKRSAVHPLVHWLWGEINKQRASQLDVEKRSGVSTSAMRKWRTGERTPRVLEFDAVAQALGFEITIRRKKDD